MLEKKAIYNLQTPLFLVGMMGSGKSRIGKLLAEKLNVAFVDIDQTIVTQEKQSINDIFAHPQKGEAYFRKLELTIINKIISTPPKIKIIAGGGGAFINPQIRSLLKKKKIFTLYLDVPLWLLWLRVKNNKERPLLHDKNPRKKLKEIYEARRATYLTADKVVSSGIGSKNKNMLRLLSALADHGMVKKVNNS